MGCAIALAERARGREAQAADRIAAAFAAVARTECRADGNRADAREMGRLDWAVELYERILDDAQPARCRSGDRLDDVSELLHDLERDAEAARCLRRCLATTRRARGGAGRSRAGCSAATCGRSVRGCTFSRPAALAQRGDAAGSRAALEKALTVYPKDVDALIALYDLSR